MPTPRDNSRVYGIPIIKIVIQMSLTIVVLTIVFHFSSPLYIFKAFIPLYIFKAFKRKPCRQTATSMPSSSSFDALLDTSFAAVNVELPHAPCPRVYEELGSKMRTYNTKKKKHMQSLFLMYCNTQCKHACLTACCKPATNSETEVSSATKTPSKYGVSALWKKKYLTSYAGNIINFNAWLWKPTLTCIYSSHCKISNRDHSTKLSKTLWIKSWQIRQVKSYTGVQFNSISFVKHA